MKKSGWRRWLPWSVAIGDLLVVAITMTLAQFVRFGVSASQVAVMDISYWVIGVLIGILWVIALVAWNSWDIRILGSGAAEYARVSNATLAIFGAIAIIAYVIEMQLARGYVAVAVTIGLLLLVLWRWIARRSIMRLRRHGLLTRSLAIVGGPGEVVQLYKSFKRAPGSGYNAVGAILPGKSLQSPSGEELPLPVLSVSRDADSVVETLVKHQIEVVAVTGGGLNPRTLRRLSWELADREISLILAPALTDIAGPRIHSHPVADLPLIHVSTPRFNGFNSVLKRMLDLIGASAALILLSPLLMISAVAIKLDDGGPVFFSQQRVGKDQTLFKMYKLRSMVVDAEAQLENLKQGSENSNVLFKMKSDPRVTRVGHVIRRYSIDEIPQLFNVILGTMSMVGPRPPLQSEVEQYGVEAMRRLTVMPGITGLWQVGGRSDLNWEESVRLDLYYVENWSIMQDLVILFRTVKVVLARDGAY